MSPRVGSEAEVPLHPQPQQCHPKHPAPDPGAAGDLHGGGSHSIPYLTKTNPDIYKYFNIFMIKYLKFRSKHNFVSSFAPRPLERN